MCPRAHLFATEQMLPMSVLTMAFAGIAFSNSRSASRGSISCCPVGVTLKLSSSASQAAFCSAAAASRVAALSRQAAGCSCVHISN